MPLEVQEFIRKKEEQSAGMPVSASVLELTAFYGYLAVEQTEQKKQAELYLTPPSAFYWFAGLDDFLEAYFPRLPAGVRQQLNFLVNHEVCDVQGGARYLVRSLPFEALWGVLRMKGLVEQRRAPSLVKLFLAVSRTSFPCLPPGDISDDASFQNSACAGFLIGRRLTIFAIM